MTEIITNECETYPAAITRPPTTLSGHRVLAWAELHRPEGSYPGGIVLAVRTYRDQPEYVTWTAYTKDGGQTWSACWGHYAGSHAQAWADFAERCADARLARI